MSNAAEMSLRGVELVRSRKLDEARRLYDSLLRADIADPDALHGRRASGQARRLSRAYSPIRCGCGCWRASWSRTTASRRCSARTNRFPRRSRATRARRCRRSWRGRCSSRRARPSCARARTTRDRAGAGIRAPRRLRCERASLRALRGALRAAADPLLAEARRSVDFYSLSGCRDLYLHAREHRFALPRIGQLLDELRLELLGFELTDAAVKRDYLARFPDNPAADDLERWQAFESERPETFAKMYVMWLRKG